MFKTARLSVARLLLNTSFSTPDREVSASATVTIVPQAMTRQLDETAHACSMDVKHPPYPHTYQHLIPVYPHSQFVLCVPSPSPAPRRCDVHCALHRTPNGKKSVSIVDLGLLLSKSKNKQMSVEGVWNETSLQSLTIHFKISYPWIPRRKTCETTGVHAAA